LEAFFRGNTVEAIHEQIASATRYGEEAEVFMYENKGCERDLKEHFKNRITALIQANSPNSTLQAYLITTGSTSLTNLTQLTTHLTTLLLNTQLETFQTYLQLKAHR